MVFCRETQKLSLLAAASPEIRSYLVMVSYMLYSSDQILSCRANELELSTVLTQLCVF